MEYKSNRNVVYSCKYHVVWCPKYRRKVLAKQLNISPHQLSYVTHSGEGEGLLFYGNIILPFVDSVSGQDFGL